MNTTSPPEHSFFSIPTIYHVTGLKQLAQCPQSFYFSQVARIRSAYNQEEDFSNPLTYGTFGHGVLADYYTALTTDEPLTMREAFMGYFHREHPEVDFRMVSDILRVLLNYEEVWQMSKWKPLAVETNFKWLDEESGFILTGTMDLIIQDSLGRKWGVDHKFLGRRPDTRLLDLDDQMTAYIYLAKQHGIKLDGMIYNYILKKPPVYPKELQSGRLSKQKSSDMTYTSYMEAIEDGGHDPADYQDILEWLRNKDCDLVGREYVTRTAHELSDYERRVRHYFKKMQEATCPDDFMVSPSLACSWCEYAMVCKSKQEGGNWQSLVGFDYEIKSEEAR